jgi:RNA polymerase sigma factor (sigma-70 family)
MRTTLTDIRDVPVDEFYAMASHCLYVDKKQRLVSLYYARKRGDMSQRAAMHDAWVHCARFPPKNDIAISTYVFNCAKWARKKLFVNVGVKDTPTKFEQLEDNRTFDEPFEEIGWNQDLKNKLNKMIDTLPARDALIVRLRTGLYSGAEWGLRSIGFSLGITHERVRQIEERAMLVLQKIDGKSMLKQFAEDAFGEIHDAELDESNRVAVAKIEKLKKKVREVSRISNKRRRENKRNAKKDQVSRNEDRVPPAAMADETKRKRDVRAMWPADPKDYEMP